MKLRDFLPASFEVSVILLVLVYVWTVVTIPVSRILPLIAAGLYLAMSAFFVGCDWWDDRRHGRHAVRLLAAATLVAPAVVAAMLLAK